MIRWSDPDRIARAVADFGSALRAEHPEVQSVIWYGSWVAGTQTPSNDVDLVVVVSHDTRGPRDRVPDYLPRKVPTGVDLAVLTEEEFHGLAERSPAWHRAIRAGRVV